MVAIKPEEHLLRSPTRGSLATRTSDSGALPQSESLTEQLVEWQVNLLERMFNAQSYVDINPDLADLETDSSALFEHFDQIGYKELRRLSSNFDPLAYLVLNDDVRDLGMNPYIHFLKFGWIEDRPTSILEDRSSKNTDDTGFRSDSVSRTRIILSSGHRLTPSEASGNSDDPYGLCRETLGILQARSQRLSLLEEHLDLLATSNHSYEKQIAALRDDLKVARQGMAAAELRVTQLKTEMNEAQQQNRFLEDRVDALERSRAVRLASSLRKLFHASA